MHNFQQHPFMYQSKLEIGVHPTGQEQKAKSAPKPKNSRSPDQSVIRTRRHHPHHLNHFPQPASDGARSTQTAHGLL